MRPWDVASVEAKTVVGRDDKGCLCERPLPSLRPAAYYIRKKMNRGESENENNQADKRFFENFIDWISARHNKKHDCAIFARE